MAKTTKIPITKKNGIWNKITYFLAGLLGVERRFLIWLILFSVLIFSIQFYANYNFTKILDDLRLKPDIEVEISPYLQTAPFGDYLPMIVTNTGDYTFRDVYIGIKTCDMEESYYMETYNLPLLPPHSERIIPFANKNVIESFKKGNCYPFSGKDKSIVRFEFKPFEIIQGKNYSTTSVGCGFCLFNAKVYANYIIKRKNEIFKKSIDGNFSSPVKLEVSISS